MKVLTEWREKNPLRVWRKNMGVSIADASVLLDASSSSIQGWESGTTTPNEHSFVALQSVLGEDIEERWVEWRDSLDRKAA